MIYFGWNIYFVQDLTEIEVDFKTEIETQAIDTLGGGLVECPVGYQ